MRSSALKPKIGPEGKPKKGEILIRLFLAVLAFSAWTAQAADRNSGFVNCSLNYEIPVEGGQVKYVVPENGEKSIELLNIRFCTNDGCRYRPVGSAFLGINGVAGASLRVVGDRVKIVLRDARGNRSALSLNTKGLEPMEDGPAAFALNADGEYKGETLSAVILVCQLVPGL